MNCKITRNAAKVLKLELDKPENEGKKLRVVITHAHGDHAHYGLDLDTPGDNDTVVSTDKDIAAISENGQPTLAGARRICHHKSVQRQPRRPLRERRRGNHG